MMPKHLVSMGALAGVLIFAGTALAEGSFDSTLQSTTGYNSRSWEDRNIDAANTTIRFDGCRDNINGNEPNDRAELQLTRETPWYEPDENRGRQTLWCFNSGTGNWGRQPASWYHFTVITVSGVGDNWVVLNVPFVRVNY